MIEQQKKEQFWCTFSVIAKQCPEVFWHYEERIPHLPRVYYHKNPDVPQIIVTAIGICAELKADFLEPKIPVIFCLLKSLMEHPDAKREDNIMAYEAVVCTCGKLNQFALEDIPTYELNLLWLNHLTIRCNLDEAKITHNQLFSMIISSEQKVIGPHGSYTPIIIAIFAEILSAGITLATEETREEMIILLKKFRKEMEPTIWPIIFKTLPQPHQDMLHTDLADIITFY